MLVWQVLVALDISSHWIQMYSSLVLGETSHKVTDLSANPIMRYYYKRVRYESADCACEGVAVCVSGWLCDCVCEEVVL